MFCPLLALMTSMNYAVDPSRVFHQQQYAAEAAGILTGGSNIDRYVAGDELLLQKMCIQRASSRRDLVVLGSSRMLQVSSPMFPGVSFFNHSVSGATIEDFVLIYYWLRRQQVVPHAVLIGIDPWILSDAVEDPRWPSQWRDYDEATALMGERSWKPRAKAVGQAWLKSTELFSPRMFQESMRLSLDSEARARAAIASTQGGHGAAGTDAWRRRRHHSRSTAAGAHGLWRVDGRSGAKKAGGHIQCGRRGFGRFVGRGAGRIDRPGGILAARPRLLRRIPYEARGPGERARRDRPGSECSGRATMIIIAEIGINHNGSINVAHELIRQARIAGADIAKFQFYDPHKIFGPQGSHPNADALAQALTVQFGFDEARQLKAWCDEEGIEFAASVFDLERFDWVQSLGVKRHKIASRAAQNAELCRRILATGLETFVSLGFWEGKGVPFDAPNARYLYCVPKYPCEYKDLHLPASFADSVYSGFSDHTIGIEAALVAVGRGATIVEKHFTLNKGLPGPDHVCSATPEELAELSRYARLMEKMR
jgi:sialic acid synthase SpsE